MNDFRTWWNLDTELCKFLATNLEGLADNTNGYPNGYETFEEWQAALHLHAKAFKDYVGMHNGITQPEDADVYRENAKASLHWVADNLEHLWD